MAEIGGTMQDMMSFGNEKKADKRKKETKKKESASPVVDQVTEEKESISVKISKETRAKLKVYCASHGLVMGDLVARLINEYLEANK